MIGACLLYPYVQQTGVDLGGAASLHRGVAEETRFYVTTEAAVSHH
jgi:hypothetical protein